MTTTPVPPIDVDLLREEIRKTYAAVSQEPEREFIFPTGRAWAEDLDYPAELANVPDSAVESFAGIANPFSLGRDSSLAPVCSTWDQERGRTRSSPHRWSAPLGA